MLTTSPTHTSSLKLHKGINNWTVSPAAIKAEPMLFRADHSFAWSNGETLTKRFLDEATDIWGNLDGVIIDSRHHMLMPGMTPCIPGWHTDDAPRSKRYCGGQPNIFDPEYKTEHLLMCIDCGTGSLTEFLLGDVTMPREYIEFRHEHHGENFYKTADRIITECPRLVSQDALKMRVKSGVIAEFDVHSWHRGVAAKKRGFRFFIRATRNSKHAVQNEIRTNAQVYLSDATYGW